MFFASFDIGQHRFASRALIEEIKRVSLLHLWKYVFLFYISYACHAFLLAINATFDFFLSCEKHQISKRITYSGLPVTASRCLREQIFLCNMQTVQAYTYMYTSTQRFQEYAQIKRSRASDKEW